jgi:hypothetical protein
VFVLIGLGVPTASFAAAAQQSGGQVAGAVRDQGGQPAVNYAVRVRNAGNGQVAGTGTTGPAGEFAFDNLTPGTYVVEVVDGSGRILATSTSIALGTGAMQIAGVAITLTETDAAAAAAAAAGGSFFTSTTGIVVMAAAGALAVGGIVVAKDKDKDKKPKSPKK